MSEVFYAGIDIGGTTAKVGLVDSYGAIIEKTQVKTQKNGSWKKVVDEYVKPIEGWIKSGKNIAGIGIGAPGAFDKNKRMLVTCVNIPELKDAPIISYIEEKFNIPVIGDNDATCAAVGEHVFGAGVKFENFLFITVGTGVGSGLILNNSVFRGRDGFAGEFGHMTVVPDGLLCSCGNRGCIECYSSATAIINNIKSGIKRGTVTSYSDVEIEDIDARMVFTKAQAGDKHSISAVDNAAKHLGMVIGSTINLLNLDAVIIGGGVAQAGNYFIDRIKFYCEQTAWKSFMDNLPIIPANLLNDAGILGAASLIIEDKHEKSV